MIEQVPIALTSLSTAKNIISSLIGLRDFASHATELHDLHKYIMEANSVIIALQNNHSFLTTKIDELEKECVRLKDWDANERQKYERKQIARGVFAYVERESMNSFENSHKMCCNCFDRTIKSTLQQGTGSVNDIMHRLLVCPNGCPQIAFKSYLEKV